MRSNRKAISEVVDVNPRIPTALASELKREVDFVPMAQLSEQGYVTPNGSRKLGDVLKGYTYFENGDVIIAKITPCMENGKAAFVDNLPHQIGFGSTEFHVLRLGDSVDGRYLFHMVWSSDFRNEAVGNMTGSAGQKRVPKAFFDRFAIPLPPLSQQKRIADILDKADAIRRKRQRAVTIFDELLKSYFVQMFGNPVQNPMGWKAERLGDIATLDRGKSRHRPRDAKFLYGGSYPLVQTGDITNSNGFIRDYSQTYSEEGLAQSKLWPAGTSALRSQRILAKLPFLPLMLAS
ncbi:MAG: restriction endonuclease subunit S [Pirellulaceae bacterium]